MTVRLELQRTFRKFNGAAGSDDDDDFDWEVWIGRKTGELGWPDVLAKRVSVVLAEAGMGKTWEFQDQAARLRAVQQSAFFLALNRVSTVEHFRLALDAEAPVFDKWTEGDQPSVFFLDSVDEARLVTPAAYEIALSCVVSALRPYLRRVTFVVSSRISDWHLDAVRETTIKQLLLPVNSAVRESRQIKEMPVSGSLDTAAETIDAPVPSEMDVFQLSPLSELDAKRLATAHGATPAEQFWIAVVDGDYQRMARRPRDLEWMAKRWAQDRKLGTFAELLEASIASRLAEHNDNYNSSDPRLSFQESRDGAEILSAACLVAGLEFVARPGESSSRTCVGPADVLKHWDVRMQNRLLSSGLFDSGTYGRFKFQHSTREYLAAKWIGARMDEGLPLAQALGLFASRSYGIDVVLKSRRSTFCWLAAFYPSVRAYMIRRFPEMLMFEGDPECWTDYEVDVAFRGYVERLRSGFRPNWWSDTSELRRVARKLSVTT